MFPSKSRMVAGGSRDERARPCLTGCLGDRKEERKSKDDLICQDEEITTSKRLQLKS